MNSFNVFLSGTKSQWGLLGILCLFTFFINNGYIPASIMEARNFITAREILESDTWLIPTMNGEFRLAKPPLPTWITAISADLAGDMYKLSALRLPAAIMATLMVFFLYGFTKTLTDDPLIPLLAGALLATSFYVVYMGRQGTWDIFCHSFMMGAIWAFVRGWKNPGTAYPEFLIGGLCLGFSFMSKGPIAFYALLLPFLISYIFAFGAMEIKAKWKQLTGALVICLFISSLWPLYVYFNVPSDLMLTVNTETDAWSNRHVRPFWHYWSFPVQSGVWTVFITAALIIPYAKKRIKSVDGNYRFLFTWVILTVVLLSLIPEKKERYLMPALLSMALLAAFYIKYLLEAWYQKKETRADVMVTALTGISLSVLCLGGPIYLFLFGYTKALLSGPVFLACTLFLLGSGLFFLVLTFRSNTPKIIGGALVFTALVSAVSPYVLDRLFFQDYTRYHKLYEISRLPAIKDLPFYTLYDIRPEEVWDIGKEVNRVPQAGGCWVLDQLPAVVLAPEDPSHLNFCGPQPLSIDTLETFRHYARKEKGNWYLYLLKPDSVAFQRK